MKHSIEQHIVPRETFNATAQLASSYQAGINTFIERLLWWNKRVNLMSRTVSRETIAKHIFHSLLLTQLDIYKRASLVVDAGTGGGLPGIPLALTTPRKRFLLNDIVTKKILAVKQIVKSLELENVDTLDQSVAKLNVSTPFLLISKHAFKINDLYTLTAEMPWETIILYKGIEFRKELGGIAESLAIEVYSLGENAPRSEAFFKDKALLVISRR